jgi:hypothetical protein
VPCLIRSGRAAVAGLVVAEQVEAVEAVAPEAAEPEVAVEAAEPEAAEPEAVVEAEVRAEREVAVEAAVPEAEREAAPEAGASIPVPTTTTLPSASRERSCRNFQLRLRRISRFLLR